MMVSTSWSLERCLGIVNGGVIRRLNTDGWFKMCVMILAWFSGMLFDEI